MVKFECTVCLFVTNKKSDFQRHLNRKKHIALCEKDEKLKQELIVKEEQIKKDYENKFLKEKLKSSQEKIKLLEKNNKCLSTIATSSTKTAQSAMSFIINNYADAPNIKAYNNFKFLKEKDHYKIADTILHKYKHKTLVDYISKLLIEEYKKDKPKEQSFWNTDVTRLSYVVKDKINNDSKWISDKKGIILSSYAIQPLVNKLKDRMTKSHKKIIKDNNKYIDERDDYLDSDSETKDKKRTNNKKIERTLSYLEHFGGFFNDIDSGNLETDIVRNIARHFFMNENV